MQNEPHLFVYRAQRTNVNSRLYPSVGANNVACVSRVRCTSLTTRIDMYYNVYFQNVHKNQTLNSSLLLNHNNKCHNCKMYSELCLPKCHKKRREKGGEATLIENIYRWGWHALEYSKRVINRLSNSPRTAHALSHFWIAFPSTLFLDVFDRGYNIKGLKVQVTPRTFNPVLTLFNNVSKQFTLSGDKDSELKQYKTANKKTLPPQNTLLNRVVISAWNMVELFLWCNSAPVTL